MWNELTFLWNELTILWNDLTIDWNDLTWNDLTMERNDRKSPLVIVSTKGITADHENWIEQHCKQNSYLIQLFYSQLL